MEEAPATGSGAARRNEDIALDLMKFVAMTTGYGRVTSTGVGFQGSGSTSDQHRDPAHGTAARRWLAVISGIVFAQKARLAIHFISCNRQHHKRLKPTDTLTSRSVRFVFPKPGALPARNLLSPVFRTSRSTASIAFHSNTTLRG